MLHSIVNSILRGLGSLLLSSNDDTSIILIHTEIKKESVIDLSPCLSTQSVIVCTIRLYMNQHSSFKGRPVFLNVRFCIRI